MIGVERIISSPSDLESTSIVFAYGTDLFYSHTSPSMNFDILSSDFSKIGLIATVAALVVGILVSGRIVKQKSIKEAWK